MREAAQRPVSDAPAELLERAAGLEALCESLASVRRSGRGRVVLVGGEAGVGKTALLRWFCREREGSAPILWGGCDPLFTPRPLGPLLSVAEEAGGPLEEVVTSGAMPHELAAALVRQLSAHPGTVFVLEDVHWADEATLDVLKLLARRVAAVPVLVVASFRDDELDPATRCGACSGSSRRARRCGG
jgi:Predicted ATPase